jgi:hypothetical protein
MHPEILNKNQQDLLPLIEFFKRKYYLVGGTAIALHIGHRMSIDFDMFTDKSFSPQDVLKRIDAFSKGLKFRIIYRETGQLHLYLNEVKLTFYHYPYSIPTSTKYLKEAKIPDLIVLAAMKAFALGGRNKWKDYVDLYFLLRDYFSFDEIASKAEELFNSGVFNRKLFKGQLTYFDDVDYSEAVDFLPGHEVPEEEIKRFLIDIATEAF